MTQPTSHNNAYLETKVLTASPEQLQLMLYDGAIRFCEQAKGAIDTKDIEQSFLLITKAEKIIMELQGAMRDDIAPETCGNMRRLYMFCYDRLVTANLKKDQVALDEAIEILKELRQTWVMLIEKVQEERAREMAPASPANEQTPELVGHDIGGTINFEG